MRIEHFIEDVGFLKKVAEEKNHFLSTYHPRNLCNFEETSATSKGNARSEENSQSMLVEYGKQLDCRAVDCAMVLYVYGKISIYPILPHEDAISFDFSGCYIATFKYKNGKFVAHIAMDGNKDTVKYWNHIVQEGIISDCILYEPTEPFQNLRHKCYWGLITSDGDCYTIDFENERKRKYDPKKIEYYYSSSYKQYPYIVRKVNPLTGKNAIIKPTY